MHNTEIS